MWFYLALVCLLTFNSTKVLSNDSHNWPTVSLLPIQVLDNSSFNSSLMESQSLLTNTSLTDLQNDNNTQRLQTRFRERKRQERLLSIQSQILQRLGISGRNVNNSAVNSFTEEERDLMNRVVQGMAPTSRTRIDTVTGANEIMSSEIFAERLQSFYSSCAIPNHTDPYLWNEDSHLEMRLYYDITFPHSLQSSTQITAVSAKLRIYKFNDPQTQGLTTSGVANTISDQMLKVVSQEGLTISLYQYIRPLRQNRREKKRLLDSRTVAWNKRGYIEFNVINAINYWQNNPFRNFGLYVDIEDPYGVRHNPVLYLTQMNCSVQDTPMPNLAQLYPDIDTESINNRENFPTLDLLTVEMAKQQVISSGNSGSNDGSSRRKRLATNFVHKNWCQTIKTLISIKDLKLEEIILYPKWMETVVCKRFGHKHEKNGYNCRPSDHKDIEFVYLDQNSKPKIKKLEKFLPQNCEYFE